MKRLLVLAFSFSSFLLSAQAPDSLLTDTLPTWKRGGIVGFNFTQTSFTNWATGGENSIAGQAIFSTFVNYRKGITSWDNNLDLMMGVIQQGKNEEVRKTDDKIDFTSKYGRYAFGKVWYYSALLGFKTQFLPGYQYMGDTARLLISDFMSPAYLMLAAGLDYKPHPKFSVLFAPLTGRTTFVLNQQLADQGAFGVEEAVYDTAGNKLRDGENVRHEFGGYIRAQFKGDIMPNVNLTGRLEFFSNYLDRPGNIDINGEILLMMKVNKYISATLNMQAIYDNDIDVPIDSNHDGVYESKGPRLQFRQVLGIGFSAKF